LTVTEKQEQKVTFNLNKELDVVTVTFSQELIIAHELFAEVSEFLERFDQEGNNRVVLTREELVNFIGEHSVLPVLTNAIPELQVEFIAYAWNYILRVVDQELSPIYDHMQILLTNESMTYDQEQAEIENFAEMTEAIIEKKCLWEICLYTTDRVKEFVENKESVATE